MSSFVLASLAVVACGSGGGETSLGNGSGSSSGAFGGGINVGAGGSSHAGTGSGSGSGSGMSAGGFDPGSACVGTSVEGERMPVDLYFMVDTTGSMNCPVPDSASDPCTTDPGAPYADTTRWVVESAALNSFIQSSKNAGMGMGIGFFPNSKNMCDADTYRTPSVEIALLPGAAPNLTAAVKAKKPSGYTPTLASLTGALRHATDYAKAHAGHRVAVVYSTDGYPVNCGSDNTIANAAKVAKDAHAATPSISTYVLAVGNNLSALNEIAAAGGTDQAYRNRHLARRSSAAQRGARQYSRPRLGGLHLRDPACPRRPTTRLRPR
ncbi:MAG: VWA domain-containing protein [Polyangiaceae bacterium]